MIDLTNFKKGPFCVIDGMPQDAEIFKEELSDENEARVDNIMLQLMLNKAAKAELARRQVQESLKGSLGALMEDLLENK